MKKLLYLNLITEWGLEAKSPVAGGYGQFFENFCNFWKKSYFNAIWITFLTFLEPLERSKFFFNLTAN